MKLGHVEQVAVFYEPTQRMRAKVGRLALAERRIHFEYDAEFLRSKLELSPFRLPLEPGVVTGKPELFDGLMGVFDDSLPDGWGKLLIDRRAVELGLSANALTPLDRLTLVGARSMGALTYEPESPLEDSMLVRLADLAAETEAVLAGTGGDLDQLIAIGGSPKGARPKVLVQLAPNGDVHFGARTIHEGFSAWIVKFRSPGDDPHTASLEHAYFRMAQAAGLVVPRTQVLGRTKRSPGYFAIERFDRSGSNRIHVHSLGGLLDLPTGYVAFDYVDLLKVTRKLTRNEAAVREMFRRACFNVLAHNRDDHSRNFEFVMSERGEWQPSPAYDLTFSSGPGGQHTMLVAGEGRDPQARHLLLIAEKSELKRAGAILDEVRVAVSKFRSFADEAGVPPKLVGSVATALGLPGPRKTSKARQR